MRVLVTRPLRSVFKGIYFAGCWLIKAIEEAYHHLHRRRHRHHHHCPHHHDQERVGHNEPRRHPFTERVNCPGDAGAKLR